MSTANLDAVDLAAVPVGGQIHEDLINKLFNITPVETPFCNIVGEISSGNQEKSWVREDLAAANKDNARVDGSDSTGNDSRTGERISNYHQIFSKIARVSDRARNVDTVGASDELVNQLMNRGKEIRCDLEAAATSRNVAVAGDGDTVPGKLAGVGGWIGTGQDATNTDRGATGADPVLSGDPGGFPTTAATEGDKQALSEATVKSVMEEAVKKGGKPKYAMSTYAVIGAFSDYLFTSSARVATLQSDVSQGTTVNEKGQGGVTAVGSVNTFVTNTGVLTLMPNLYQPQAHALDATVADLYLIDPDLWDISYLQGFKTQDLARTGLAENREISGDVTLVSYNEEGNAVIADIDSAIPAVE